MRKFDKNDKKHSNKLSPGTCTSASTTTHITDMFHTCPPQWISKKKAKQKEKINEKRVVSAGNN